MSGEVRATSRFGSWDIWLALVCTISIFVLGSLPSPPSGPPSLSDKALHFLGFGLLAGSWCRALRVLCPAWPPKRVWLGSFLVAVVLGGALELWQGLLAYRSCELLDWVADIFGAVFGVALYAALLLMAKPRTRAS